MSNWMDEMPEEYLTGLVEEEMTKKEKERKEKHDKWMKPVAKQIKDIYHPDNAKKLIPVYLTEIDDAMGGGVFPVGQVSILMGPTGFGKTTFMLNAAVKQCQNGFRVVIISLEMSKTELLSRIYAILTGEKEIENRLDKILEKGEGYYEEKLKEIEETIVSMLGDKLIIIDDQDITHEELLHLMPTFVEHQVDIVYLDNINLLQSETIKKSTEVKIMEQISNEIRSHTQRYKAFAFVHLSQITEEKTGDYRNAKVRDARKLLHDAAVLVNIYPEPEEEDNVHRLTDRVVVQVKKNRFGASPEHTYAFDKPRQRIGEYHYIRKYSGLDLVEITEEDLDVIFNQEIEEENLDQLFESFGGGNLDEHPLS